MFSLSNWILNRSSGCLICTFSACPFTKPDKVNTVFPNPLPLILCSKVLLFFLIRAFSLFRNRFLKSVYYEGVAGQGEVKKAEAKVSGSQDTDFVIRHLADNEHSAEMMFHEIQLQVVLLRLCFCLQDGRQCRSFPCHPV